MDAWTNTPTKASISVDNNTSNLNFQSISFVKGIVVHEFGHMLCLNDINGVIAAY